MIEAQNPDGTDPLVPPLTFHDRFGNTYTPEELEIPHSLQDLDGAFLVGDPGCAECGRFLLFFDDVINETDFGFNESDWYGDPIDGITLGDKRREVVCQVFSDLSILIPPATSDDMVNIQILSEGDGTEEFVPSGAAGAGSSYYLPLPDSEDGWIDALAWKTIISGNSEYDDLVSLGYGLFAASFHGRLGVRFPSTAFCYDLEWTEDVTGTDCFDLYTVVLHESLHVLGVGSSIGPDGISTRDDFPNLYNRYDSYLQNGVGEPLVPFDIDNYYGVGFNTLVGTDEMENGCGSIYFVGNHTSTLLTPEIGQELYTAGGFSIGTTLSHFMCYEPDPSDLSCTGVACPSETSDDGYSVHNCLRCDDVQRFRIPPR